MSEENIVSSRYPRAKIPKGISLPQLLLEHFAEYGDKVALISPKTNQSLTFADLISLSRRTAIGLHRKAEIRRRDVVGICATNRAELFPIMLGVQLLGAVVNTANPAYTVRELIHQFGGCKTRFVVTTSDLVEKVELVKGQCKSIRAVITFDRRVNGCLYLPDLLADDDKGFQFPVSTCSSEETPEKLMTLFQNIDAKKDLAFLLNSSGTTGLPKAVMLTHRSVMANICQVSQRYLESPAPALFTPTTEDTIVSVFPLFHIGGICGGFWPLMNGATMLMFDRFDSDVFLDAIRTYKATALFAPPPVLILYTKSAKATKEDFASLKYVLCGAAPVSKELVEAVAEKMQPEHIVQTYGMTETSLFCNMVPLNSLSWQKSGSCGVLVPNTQCKVIDIETGRAVGTGIHGEICVRGAQLMEGYLNNEKATQETIDHEGWLHTGDIGYYDEDEYIFIVDRIKDLIKVKGFQVAPAELEAILFSHPGIADATVVGVPDAFAGEVPQAYVVLKPSFETTEEEIKAFVAGHVISYKRLAGGVVFMDEIPKTASGKYLRRQLREKARGDVQKSKL